MGPLVDWVDLAYVPRAVDVFDWITWKTAYSAVSIGPDTTRLVFQHPRDSLAFDTCGELWRMTFVPVDTGSIFVDALHTSTDYLQVESRGELIPVEWRPARIRVLPACSVPVVGDTDLDGLITPVDILCLAHQVLLGDPCVQPCEAAGDMNCDGVVNSADVISLVRHQYYQGKDLCNICHEISQGTWACP